MSKLNLGNCGICETEIWTIVNKRMVPTEKYAEIWFSLSNNTIAKHAICTDCKSTITKEQVIALFERIKETWADEMVGWATDRQFAKMRKLEVLDFEHTEFEVNIVHKAAMTKLRIDKVKKDTEQKIKIEIQEKNKDLPEEKLEATTELKESIIN